MKAKVFWDGLAGVGDGSEDAPFDASSLEPSEFVRYRSLFTKTMQRNDDGRFPFSKNFYFKRNGLDEHGNTKRIAQMVCGITTKAAAPIPTEGQFFEAGSRYRYKDVPEGGVKVRVDRYGSQYRYYGAYLTEKEGGIFEMRYSFGESFLKNVIWQMDNAGNYPVELIIQVGVYY